MSYVYWIFNETCNDHLVDGYIGVTDYLDNRIKYHKTRNPRIPKDSELLHKVIFEGSREECFELEQSLRPSAGIGWNGAKGGVQGWVSEFTHSNVTIQKLKDAWTDERRNAAAQPRPAHAEKLTGRTKPKHSILMTGEGNPMFGQTHGDEARKKMSESRKGKATWNKGITGFKQPTVICPHCKKEGGEVNMKRYHFDECKLRKQNV